MKFEQKAQYDINDMQEIMRILRSENGCPWDREQDHHSIRKDFIEEVYEAVEAIDMENPDMLREELGDVLLQVIFHTRLEEEKGTFTFGDVVDEVCKKLIVRHPHVFGDVKVENTDEVLKNWNNIKQETKGQETYTDTLNSVCSTLPALMKAQKLSSRAKRAGMEFSSADDAANELCAAAEKLRLAVGTGEKTEAALGKLLFLAANLSGMCKLDAEEALLKSCERFKGLFAETEKLIRFDGIDMKSLNINGLRPYVLKASEMSYKTF